MRFSPGVTRLSLAIVAEAGPGHERFLRMPRTRRSRPAGNAAPCAVKGPAGGAALFRHQAVIVTAPCFLKASGPPSLTTISQGNPPGGVVAVLTGTSHVTLVGLEWTFVA